MQLLKDAKWILPWLEKSLWSAPIPSTSSQMLLSCPLMETVERETQHAPILYYILTVYIIVYTQS